MPSPLSFCVLLIKRFDFPNPIWLFQYITQVSTEGQKGVFVFQYPPQRGKGKPIKIILLNFWCLLFQKSHAVSDRYFKVASPLTGLNTFLCSVEGYIMKYYTCSKHPLGALDTPNLFAFRRKKQILRHILILLDFFILCQNPRLSFTLGKDEPRRQGLKFW